MAVRNNILAALLLLFGNLCIANAGEYRLGNFEFDIPGSWDIKADQTEVVATYGDRKPVPNSLLKIEICIPSKSQCGAELLFPPAAANPENYYCGEVSPTITHHSSGLKEFRKICSVSQEGSTTRIGMLYLSSEVSNLGLIIMTDPSGPIPADFLKLFLSTLVIK